MSTFGYPVIRQGSVTTYEDAFFTFWNNDTYDTSYYDNTNKSRVYDYDVNFYSTSPVLTYSKLREAVTLLKQHDYIVSGDGYDLASDEGTHTGRGINVLYLN